jgi:hypothetical protein
LRTSQSSDGGGSGPARPEDFTATHAGRLTTLWRRLDPDQRLAGLAAIALGASIFLPWWRDPGLHVTLVGVRRLTFIEVALFLVAAAVLFLLLRRAEGKAFHLPLSDGTLIAAAGIWTCILVAFRMLDPPTRKVGTVTTDYGMRWGILFALASAALLAVAGMRTRRRHHRGQPEAVAADADAAEAATQVNVGPPSTGS